MVQIAGKQIPKWLVVLLTVGVVIGVAGNVSSCLDQKVAQAPTAATPEPAEQPKVLAATPKPKPVLASGAVTESSVKAALSGINLAKVQVQDNLGTDVTDDKIVHITYKPEGAADQSPRLMLMDLAKVSAMAFEKLFANQGVTAVDVTAQVPMVGTDGSEKSEAGARIYWDRKKAESVDFKQYRENVAESYFWDAYVGAPDFYVHPGVRAALSEKDQAKLGR